MRDSSTGSSGTRSQWYKAEECLGWLSLPTPDPRYAPVMITRPTEEWRDKVQQQKAAVAAGTLNEAQAYALHLWPESFIDAVDVALDQYEADARWLRGLTDEQAFASVERVVSALNAIDVEHGCIETTVREELCEYIDDVLAETGVDVDALTARRGIPRHELTDQWRDW